MSHSGLELSSSVPQGSAQLLSEKGACVTGLPFCYINHTKHSAELATGVATPLSGCAGLPPRESVSRDFRVAIAPLQITFACHPIQGGKNKPLYVYLKSQSRTMLKAGCCAPACGEQGNTSHTSEHILHYANWICKGASATRKSSESVTAVDEGTQ